MGTGIMGRNYGYNTRRNEFTLVKSSNIVIPAFSGADLNNYTYLPFHKSIGRFIYNQGEDGELLLELLIEIEKWGGNTFHNEQVKELSRQCLKAAEYNRAIMSALLNYIAGVAKGMVEYGGENGFDAWRRFYNHCRPFAEDLQQILTQELYTPSPVIDNNIDNLFNQEERITELYTKTGRPDDAISEQWIKVAVLRNLPKQVTKDLAMQFRDTKTVNDVRNIVNLYIYIYARPYYWNVSRPSWPNVMHDGRSQYRGRSQNIRSTNAISRRRRQTKQRRTP